MFFDSPIYVVFLVLVVVIAWRLRWRNSNLFLLGVSYFFYGWWDWRFLALLIITTVVDFAIGIRIEEAQGDRAKRSWLISQLVFNLGILGFFKYANFFIDSAQQLTSALGLSWAGPALHIILPVGISFFVFHEISYAVDIYRGRFEAECSIGT